MNLIKRLRRRETNNIQQKFHYTRGILIALAQEPTLVIPVSKQAVTQLQPLNEESYESLFIKHKFEPSSVYQKIRLFNIEETEVLHYKCYILLYTTKNANLDVTFNLYQSIQLCHDLLLQVGRTIS